MKTKLFVVLGLLLVSLSAFAETLNDDGYAYQMGTKSYLIAKRGIEVPANTSEPMYIARNPKTGKRELVAKVENISNTCMIFFVKRNVSDIVFPSSTISVEKTSAGRDDDIGWVYMKLTYSSPIESIHCYNDGDLVTIPQLRAALKPFFEIVADSDNR